MQEHSKRLLSLLLALLFVICLLPGAFADEGGAEDPEASPSVADTERGKPLEKIPFWKRDKSGLPQNDWTDVESTLTWYYIGLTFKHTGDWDQDLLCLAKSQVGYRESRLNYRDDSAGKRHGYTRYGAWYSNPYGEWCAMFACFCLNYAGIPETVVPWHANCYLWQTKLFRQGLFTYKALAGEPRPGDLVFLGKNGQASHMGIVCEVRPEENRLLYIQGNDEARVAFGEVPLNSLGIIGYCTLPQNPARSGERPAERIVRAVETALLPSDEGPLV